MIQFTQFSRDLVFTLDTHIILILFPYFIKKGLSFFTLLSRQTTRFSISLNLKNIIFLYSLKLYIIHNILLFNYIIEIVFYYDFDLPPDIIA